MHGFDLKRCAAAGGVAALLVWSSPGLGAGALDGQAGPSVSGPQLASLLQRNPFDPEGKLWPDRKPLPPPPPPPAPVTEQDVEVVGVVAAPGVQRAWVRLGPRFAGAGSGSRGVVALGVGAALGEYTLAQVQPDQVLLKAPGGVEQWVRVYAKSSRAGGPAPVAAAGSAAQLAPPSPAAVTVSSGPSAGGGSSSGQAVLPSPGAGAAGAPAEPVSAPVQPAAGASVSAPPGSLAAAIEAARAAAAQNGGAAPQAPAFVNPFEALIKQQSIRP